MITIEDDAIEPRNEAQPFRAEVIDLDGVRIQWGLPARRGSGCKHMSLVYSEAERRVWCEDCKRTVENFDAFMIFTQHFEKMVRASQAKMAEVDEAMKATARLRAVKALDRVWSGRVQAVMCPHCRGGLLPEDFADQRIGSYSREYELARRARGNVQ